MSRTVLDLIGEVCPVPLMRTSEAVDRLPAGSELMVETDYPRALTNIVQWCFRHGYPYEILDFRRGVYRVVIRKETPPSVT
ncbi:MAG TPA: sulfurtransferase TusA family protein [Symbiobacteriaceae bacterium]|nr:sulfurtransferase TusA family protein [Symbiobacteriaceae bacterium]